jgi:hypothetical protein
MAEVTVDRRGLIGDPEYQGMSHPEADKAVERFGQIEGLP